MMKKIFTILLVCFSFNFSYSQNLYDHDLIYHALESKQKLLDSRRNEIQVMYDSFWDISLLKLKQLGENAGQDKFDYVFQVDELLRKYSSYDLTNNDTWYQIKNFYSKHKNVILSW